MGVGQVVAGAGKVGEGGQNPRGSRVAGARAWESGK